MSVTGLTRTTTRSPVVVHDILTGHSIVFSRPGGRVVRASRRHLLRRLGVARARQTLVGVNGVDLDEQAIQTLLDQVAGTSRTAAA